MTTTQIPANVLADNYINAVNAGSDPGTVGQDVADLTIPERISLREELKHRGFNKLVRTLWYDYDAQRFF